jgi:hypothetical protein
VVDEGDVTIDTLLVGDAIHERNVACRWHGDVIGGGAKVVDVCGENRWFLRGRRSAEVEKKSEEEKR